jgi:hypothetical protein
MNKRLWHFIKCYHTPPGTSVSFEMWLMQQRFYKLLSFRSGLMICSTYIQMVHSVETCTQIKVSPIALTRWVTPKWDVFKLNSYSTLGFRMISAYQTRFQTNLISFINKHDHIPDMVILFPSSTPIVNPFYFLHQLPLPRVNSWLNPPPEIRDIISPLCGS